MLNYSTFKNNLKIIKIFLILFFFSFLAIGVHELGHLIANFFVGIKVTCLSVGAGPEIINTKINGIKILIKAIPSSGFVKMDLPHKIHVERLIIGSFGGPLAGLFLFLILSSIYYLKVNKIKPENKGYYLFILLIVTHSFFLDFSPMFKNIETMTLIIVSVYCFFNLKACLKDSNESEIKKFLFYFLLISSLYFWSLLSLKPILLSKELSDGSLIWLYIQILKNYYTTKAKLYTALFIGLSSISIIAPVIITKKILEIN